MASITSKAKLIKDLRVAVDTGTAHSVCLDLPPELGTDMGPTALELAVMSLSGCFTTIFSDCKEHESSTEEFRS